MPEPIKPARLPTATLILSCLTVFSTSCLSSPVTRDRSSNAALAVHIPNSNYVAPPLLLSEISGSSILQHDFTIENPSANPVTIQVDRISCGCLELRIHDPNSSGRALHPADEFVLAPRTSKLLSLIQRLNANSGTQTHVVYFRARSAGGTEHQLSAQKRIRPGRQPCHTSSTLHWFLPRRSSAKDEEANYRTQCPQKV
jgi:hypothetical protein